MNDKKEALRGVHPGLKRLFQPSAEDHNPNTTASPENPSGKITINTWRGYLLCNPCKYSSATANDTIDYIDHDFEDINEAGSFVCSVQLHRSDLTNSYRKYLIGKKFSYEEALFHKTNRDIPKICKNAEELAFHILMEQIKVSHENTIELSRLTPDEIRYLSQAVIEQRLKHLTFQDIRHECEWKHTNNKSSISRSEKREIKESPQVSIRQMPAYNPDADVNSLCMTIDSWVSSIKRVNQAVDFSTISRKAMINLVRQLTILEQTVNMLQKTLTERDSQ